MMHFNDNPFTKTNCTDKAFANNAKNFTVINVFQKYI